MYPTLTFSTLAVFAADPGKKSTLPDLLGNINVQNKSRFDLDEADEIFEGFGQRRYAYPYTQRIGYARALQETEIPVAILENDSLRAVFLPNHGGRLWRLTDKHANRELLYTNDVLRYSNLAVCGAWFSGGVEWNIGVIGHTPFTTESLFTARTVTSSGAPVLRMYEYERVRGVTYQMDFWLEVDDTVLNCRMRIENTSADTVPMYWWSNIAVPEWKGGRIAVPADAAFTQNGDKIFKTPIPLENGTDVSCYNTIPHVVDYFFDIPDAIPKYIAAVDEHGDGLLQLSTSRLRGRKLFSWGHAQASYTWQRFLTEQAGDYVEIQAGLAKTQYGCIPMAPHTAWEWLEQYGAVHVPAEVCKLSRSSFTNFVTETVVQRMKSDDPAKRLSQTREMALSPAELIYEGSGYGALENARRAADNDRPLPKQLAFPQTDSRLKKWEIWLKTGAFPKADPMEVPDLFLFGDHYQAHLCKLNPEVLTCNWMAQYQMGLLWFTRADFERAEACMARSFAIMPNAWAHHAFACICLQQDNRAGAREHILAGLDLRSNDASFLRETFVILGRISAWEDICALWETLAPEQRNDDRIRLLYMTALGETGESAQAFSLLSADGGFVPNDIREGESTLSDLYLQLYREIYKTEAPSLPAVFDFRMQIGQ